MTPTLLDYARVIEWLWCSENLSEPENLDEMINDATFRCSLARFAETMENSLPNETDHWF